jgi:hypothetical protein
VGSPVYLFERLFLFKNPDTSKMGLLVRKRTLKSEILMSSPFTNEFKGTTNDSKKLPKTTKKC